MTQLALIRDLQIRGATAEQIADLLAGQAIYAHGDDIPDRLAADIVNAYEHHKEASGGN